MARQCRGKFQCQHTLLTNGTELYGLVDSLQKSIRVQNSKFGLALVIETMPQSGGYILGFRVDPADQLNEVAKEIQNIHSVFAKNPVFGVNFVSDDKVSKQLYWKYIQRR